MKPSKPDSQLPSAAEALERVHMFETVLSATADFNYIFNRKGRFTYVNRALCDLLQLTPEDIIGRDFHELKYPPALATKLQTQIEQVFISGEQLKDETPFTGPDNILSFYEYIFVPVMGEKGDIIAVAGSTRDISTHKRAQAALLASEAALRKSEADLAALNKDLEKRVTERSEELESKARELVQSQKLEAMGRLSAGIAHDFNNLITGILGITEDVRDQLGKDSPHWSDLDEVMKAGQKASQLTQQLLAFGRRKVGTQRVLNLNTVIREMSRLLERILGDTVELHVDLDPQLGLVRSDRSHLEQVVVNLSLNARDAMPEGGRIRIETTNVHLSAHDSQRHFKAKPGDYVALTVIDSGIGMSPETLKNIFEPFFTTKEQGKGTGMGLATVYGIIQQNNGDIAVTTELNKGSRFQIYLPRVYDAEEERPAAGGSSEASTRTETILIVEDEDIVRRVAVRALEKVGYRVIQARNGDEALAAMKRLTQPLDLLVTDVVMPGMNGRQIADLLQDIQPGLLVLFMSGHPRDILIEKKGFDTSMTFIEKSFTAQSFRQKVRDVLDAKKSA